MDPVHGLSYSEIIPYLGYFGDLAKRVPRLLGNQLALQNFAARPLVFER
jgi:hypothetical protein